MKNEAFYVQNRNGQVAHNPKPNGRISRWGAAKYASTQSIPRFVDDYCTLATLLALIAVSSLELDPIVETQRKLLEHTVASDENNFFGGCCFSNGLLKRNR